jgi:hypothetical protein
MFDHPVTIALKGRSISIESVEEACDLLTKSWPGERGPRHRDALETCLKVIDGHRSTIDAETRFREAACEAGILDESV